MSNTNLLLEVAHMYYELDMTQQQIANQVYVSRSRVSRLLKEAKESGLVEITIRYPYDSHAGLEETLHKRFGIETAIVVNSENIMPQEVASTVCKRAADHISGFLDEDSVLSVSWGKTMHGVVNSLDPRHPIPEMKVVQIAGALEGISNPLFDELDLVRKVAHLYGCEYRCLLLPFVAESSEQRDAFMARANTREVFECAKDINIFCTSVGTLAQWAGHLEAKEIASLKKQGAVGCIAGYFYDINGHLLQTSLDDRLIRADASVFRTAQHRICVTSDHFKANALLGALRGGLINTLITDTHVAQCILNSDEKLPHN